MSRDEFPSAPRKFFFFKGSQMCCLITSCSVFLGQCSHSCQDFGLMCPSFFLPSVFRSKGKRYKPCVVRSQAALERLMDSR